MTSHSRRATPAAVLTAIGLVWLVLAFGVANPLVLNDEYAYLMEGRELDRLPRLFALQPSLTPYDSPLFLRLVASLGVLPLPDRAALKLLDLAFVLAAVAALHRMATGPKP